MRWKTPSGTCVDGRRARDNINHDRRAPAVHPRPCGAAPLAACDVTVSTDHPAAEAPEDLPSEKVTTNAMYLVAATIVTSLIGLLFWGLAARWNHHTSAFGSAYAEVSAMTLLSIVGQFNLSSVFIRFLPGAGRLSMYFVRRGYLVVVVSGVVLAVIFVASGVGSKFMPKGFGDNALFVIAVGLFGVFTIQDAVLTALRVTKWVPIENATFAVAKLALLAVLVSSLSAQTAIVLAWVLPVGAAVLLVNGVLFTRVLPQLSRRPSGTLPPRKRLASFVAAEYLQTLSGAAAAALLPLVVIWKLGSAGDAYFAVPWLISGGITTVFWNIGFSLIVETVTAGEHSAARLRRALAMWGVLVIASIIACDVIGPTVLGLIGHAYQAHGATLLRAIGLSTPFTSVTMVFLVFAWLDQRVWLMLVISVCTVTALFALSIVLIPVDGVAGVGWAFLISQAAAAVLMAPRAWARVSTILRSPEPIPVVDLRDRRRVPQPRRPEGSTPSPRTTATAWIGLAVAIFAPLLIAGAPRSGLSLVAVLAIAFAGFGPAVMCRLDTGDPVAQVAVTIALSLAVFALGSALLIWLAWWHPTALLVLAVPSAASCLHRLVSQYRPRPMRSL